MITLATLLQATEQEVFDQAAKHLLTQEKKSQVVGDIKNQPKCAYRGKNDTKCAAGCFISDEEMNRIKNTWSWRELVLDRLAPKDHELLIHRLQVIHDDHDVSEWHEKLSKLASKYNFEFKF